MEFKGYQRENGDHGIRNHVLVMCSTNCASGITMAVILLEMMPWL